MKVPDIIAFLQTLPQDKEVLVADYYYDMRDGFIPLESVDDLFAHARDTRYNKTYGDVILFDTKSNPRY